MTTQSQFSRRHDLDWLRIIAFGLLIFYHVGMFYVGWDWHVKSRYADDTLEPLMMMINPWRLALLFFISGVAAHFLLDKFGAVRFFRDRLFRLGVPLIFGMLVVVMPQSYFQLLDQNEIQPGILHFWPQYLDVHSHFSIITPTWNHLWYIVYLLAYCLILVPFAPLLKAVAAGPVGRWYAGLPLILRMIVLPLAPFILYTFTLDPHFPTNHELWGDWANHAHSFTIFLYGYLAAKSERWWKDVRAMGNVFPVLALILGVALFVAYEHWDTLASLVVAEGWRTALSPANTILRTVYAWSVILTWQIVAMKWLSKPGPVLRYMTGMIFCWYVLHQTLIIIIGHTVTQWGLGEYREMALVIAGTVLGCLLLGEVIRRIPVIRPLFGIKYRNPFPNWQMGRGLYSAARK